MKQTTKTMIRPMLYALLAAVFYAINTPVSKLLLTHVPPTMMAAFLYLGAGLGVGLMYLPKYGKEAPTERITRNDIPYTIGMIVLDILAPIFLMLGIKYGSASDASLLGNFEIVATSLIALLFFREKVSGRLWMSIGLITISSMLLSLDGGSGLQLSIGSLFVLMATMCWGLENNCTRAISEKSTYEIVLLKGVFSGGGSFLIALLRGEEVPHFMYLVSAMLLGFVAYGLSIFLYVRAQRDLGAAKTSAYYAVAPFIGALLSFAVLKEELTVRYLIAALIMIAGTILTVLDTLVRSHAHKHTHTYHVMRGGVMQTVTIEHSHAHNHYVHGEKHGHHHSIEELEASVTSHMHSGR
ncbi:MAG: DMT family transporter [Lachnospiraceae bacterium]|nr:DMT family transporter [Lachnospiraceae bacterium]